MSVLFDTSALLLALQPDAKPPIHPETGQPLEYARERVDYLIRRLNKAKTQILIPAPVLSEILVYAGRAADQYIQNLQKPPFKTIPFGNRAAWECAEAIRQFGIKGRGIDCPRAKVKFDRQIVAIAQVEGVSVIYSDDQDIFRYAQQANIKVIRSWELELDLRDCQGKLALDYVMIANDGDSSYF